MNYYSILPDETVLRFWLSAIESGGLKENRVEVTFKVTVLCMNSFCF